MRRFFTLSFTQVLLWALVAQLNDSVAGYRVYVFAGALFVTFAALTQPLRPGMFATCIGGLICDANAPVTFGVHLLLFAGAHTILYRIRDRVPQDDNIAITVVGLLTNLALFLVFSFGQIHSSPAPAAVWPRLLVDLLCSQVFIVLVIPWFFALQARSLEIAQVVSAVYERRFRSRRI
jgi:cell shape-determining protein MreD